MTCHLSGELVDRPNHVHRELMAQPTFGNSNGSEIANKHFQQGASASLIKIDRFQIIRVVFLKCGHNQKRRAPNRCVTAIGSGRKLARGELFSNQNNESKYFRGNSAIVGRPHSHVEWVTRPKRLRSIKRRAFGMLRSNGRFGSQADLAVQIFDVSSNPRKADINRSALKRVRG
jgi:hypothetical protein